jgi:arylsulfatase A-like enzyme
MRILFLDLDTLRPDHLGCYGYHRNTSPNIDRIASEGVRFSNYYCSDAPCLPSRAGLMSGRFGIHTGVAGHGGTAADMRLEGSNRGFRDRMAYESLPAILRKAGMRTVSVSPFAERHSAWWFHAGFTEIYNTGKGGMESAEEITPTALDWIKRNAKSDNWMLHINYWDAHTPYRAPKEFGNPFENDPLPDWLTEETLATHRRMVGPHTAREINMYDNATNPRYPRHPGEINDMQDMKNMVDGYDCGIRYMDQHIGLVLEEINKQVPLEELMIIITADHGENLGELGIYGEHGTADYITPHIPMIIRLPGDAMPRVDDGLHYQIDLLPTLADLLHADHSSNWDGTSFLKALIDGVDCGRDYLVLSQCAHVCQRGVRFQNFMYVRTYHDGYHLFPDEMLFDVNADPHETCSIADVNPELCREAASYLSEWHAAMMKSNASNIDPLWTVMREGGPFHARGELKRYMQRLETTERGWAIDELKRRHPEELKG